MKHLTKAEFESAEKRAKVSGIHPDTCPTCGSRPEYNEDVGDYLRPQGQYTFRGKVYNCDCDEQIKLRKHYLVANIPDQYQRLGWDEFHGKPEVKDLVAKFLDNWHVNKVNGMGLELRGRQLGVGKTFAATYVGKELIKKGEDVFFIEFRDLISAFTKPDAYEIDTRLRETNVVIVDEVKPPTTIKQGELFSEQLEGTVRHRTNWNAVTIMTTNMTDDELRDIYPRIYSLLSAKQFRVDMEGKDFRMAKLEIENQELAMNGEVRPIT